LYSFALAVQLVEDRHYANNCAEHFKSVATAWGVVSKVRTFGTDTDRNMTAAIALLPFEHMPCVAHSLQLSANKAITEAGIDCVLSKSRKIVGHFKHSPANTSSRYELKQQQVHHNQKCEPLIQDVATRWNSNLQMIERFIRNKEPVLATLASPLHKHKLQLPTESEWDKLRRVQSLLEPCRYATELLGTYPALLYFRLHVTFIKQ